jgi:transposase
MTQASATDIIIGVDTHKHTHAAVAITGLGARVAELTIKVGRHGYRQLEAWAASLGTIHAFGIEGTGSYGAGLARALRDGGHTVHEVSRPDRRLRRQHGKTDHLDAEGAARAQGNRLNRDEMPHWQDGCLRPGRPRWSQSGKLLTSLPFSA